jgi:DNA-nicking Smr family endonuclease
MSDFGKILDQWESTRSIASLQARDDRDDFAKRLKAHLDTNPPEDKDVLDEGREARTGHLRPERVRIDDTIDLHGMTVEEALSATERFIEESVRHGYRKVLVVHGKGENGLGVLKREVRSFLERHPTTGAMGYPKGADGGRGALWVMLRVDENE